MPNFRYKARDKYGRAASGTIELEDRETVSSYLKNTGFTPVSIEPAAGVSAAALFILKYKKVNLENLLIFTRQLVTLLSAGMPILMSLEAIKEQTQDKKLKGIVVEIIKGVKAGTDLSYTMSRYPEVFDNLYINMIKAGEAAGILDSILDRLATLIEYQIETGEKIKSATRYPIIVVTTLVAAFLFVVTFVLPRFAELFSRFDVALPLPTRILIAINFIIKNYWYFVAFVLAFSIFILKKYIATKNGRQLWDYIKLKCPIFGPLILKITISRFTRTSAALIKSGIPLLQILDMSSQACGNTVVSDAIYKIRAAVNEGRPMHEGMKATRLFPPIIMQMIAVGENTGKLDELMLRISDYYDRHVDHTLKNLATSIEPILVFCLGGMVLTMALAIFLPMWNIMQLFRR